MRFLILCIPFLLLGQPFHDVDKIKEISSSVVKIFTVYVKPNYYQPWQMRAQKSSTGSGVIIDNKLILTAAHVVSNDVFLEIKKSANPKKFIAHVKWISHEADLALLEVEDEDFFEDTKPLQLGELPHRQDGVAVYGYPQGGNEISITQGIISRIEQTVYVHSDFDLLSLQIDAAINPGNSGGPLVARYVGAPDVVSFNRSILRRSLERMEAPTLEGGRSASALQGFANLQADCK